VHGSVNMAVAAPTDSRDSANTPTDTGMISAVTPDPARTKVLTQSECGPIGRDKFDSEGKPTGGSEQYQRDPPLARSTSWPPQIMELDIGAFIALQQSRPNKDENTEQHGADNDQVHPQRNSCRSGLRSDDPPGHRAKAPEPMKAIHDRRVPSTTQPGSLKVHCDVDNAVGGQHHRRTQQKHPPGFGKPDNLQTAQQNQHEQNQRSARAESSDNARRPQTRQQSKRCARSKDCA
jgi:hypothetical protein